ncbi:MAG: hypothetical protein M3540_11610 [Actinomycetota bacterium]|nr:hypothetical protein [Actinomycetota bacterium]
MAARMAERGAHVTVIVRRHRLTPHFLPYASQFLSARFQRAFAALSPTVKYTILRYVHQHGAVVTPRSYRDMLRVARRERQEPGTIELALGSEVVVAHERTDATRLFLTNGWTRDVDYIVCATGFSARLPSHTSVEWSGETGYEQVIGGFPLLHADYERQDLPCAFVLGYLAQLGPRGPIDSILYDTQSTVARIAAAIENRLRAPRRRVLAPDVGAA